MTEHSKLRVGTFLIPAIGSVACCCVLLKPRWIVDSTAAGVGYDTTYFLLPLKCIKKMALKPHRFEGVCLDGEICNGKRNESRRPALMIASGLMNSAYGLRLCLAEVRLLRCMSELVCAC